MRSLQGPPGSNDRDGDLLPTSITKLGCWWTGSGSDCCVRGQCSGRSGRERLRDYESEAMPSLIRPGRSWTPRGLAFQPMNYWSYEYHSLEALSDSIETVSSAV